MIELQTSVKQDDTTRTRTPKPGYLNLSINSFGPQDIVKSCPLLQPIRLQEIKKYH
jgi:hypothetical protein